MVHSAYHCFETVKLIVHLLCVNLRLYLPRPYTRLFFVKTISTLAYKLSKFCSCSQKTLSHCNKHKLQQQACVQSMMLLSVWRVHAVRLERTSAHAIVASWPGKRYRASPCIVKWDRMLIQCYVVCLLLYLQHLLFIVIDNYVLVSSIIDS